MLWSIKLITLPSKIVNFSLFVQGLYKSTAALQQSPDTRSVKLKKNLEISNFDFCSRYRFKIHYFKYILSKIDLMSTEILFALGQPTRTCSTRSSLEKNNQEVCRAPSDWPARIYSDVLLDFHLCQRKNFKIVCNL